MKKLVQSRARHFTKPLKCARKFKQPLASGILGGTVHPDFFNQCLRFGSVLKKMRACGFDGFSSADIVYADPAKTTHYVALLIHIHDDIVPSLNIVYTRDLLPDHRRATSDPQARWVRANTAIAAEKHERDRLASRLNTLRSVEEEMRGEIADS